MPRSTSQGLRSRCLKPSSVAWFCRGLTLSLSLYLSLSPNPRSATSSLPIPALNPFQPGKVCGVGPGLVFAAELQRRQLEVSDRPPPERIGLVPCAIGGSSLSDWDREGPLYRAMVDRTAAALQGGGTLRCMLWYQVRDSQGSENMAGCTDEWWMNLWRLRLVFILTRTTGSSHGRTRLVWILVDDGDLFWGQGESDTTSAELAEAYTSKMEALIQAVRADLNHPDLPVIQASSSHSSLRIVQLSSR